MRGGGGRGLPIGELQATTGALFTRLVNISRRGFTVQRTLLLLEGANGLKQ